MQDYWRDGSIHVCVFFGIETGRSGRRESVTRENARDIQPERGRDIEQEG